MKLEQGKTYVSIGGNDVKCVAVWDEPDGDGNQATILVPGAPVWSVSVALDGRMGDFTMIVKEKS